MTQVLDALEQETALAQAVRAFSKEARVVAKQSEERSQKAERLA